MPSWRDLPARMPRSNRLFSPPPAHAGIALSSLPTMLINWLGCQFKHSSSCIPALSCQFSMLNSLATSHQANLTFQVTFLLLNSLSRNCFPYLVDFQRSSFPAEPCTYLPITFNTLFTFHFQPIPLWSVYPRSIPSPHGSLLKQFLSCKFTFKTFLSCRVPIQSRSFSQLLRSFSNHFFSC